MANTSHQSVTGFKELSAVLQQIPRDLREKVMKPAMVRAVQPVKAAAKNFAKRSEDTGALRASIDYKVVDFKKGAVAVGMVGASKGQYHGAKKVGKKGDRSGANVPSKYSHLVEYGHYTAAKSGVRPADLARGTKGKTRRKGTLYEQAFVLPKPFLRPALETTRTQVSNELYAGISKGIEATRRRMVKAGTHIR